MIIYRDQSMMKQETIGNRLKRLRLQAKLLQIEAIAALDELGFQLDRSYLSKIENDRGLPSWPVACALADLYKVPLDYLRYGDSPPPLETTSYFAQNPLEIALLRAWRNMSEDEREAMALIANRLSLAEND